MIPSPLPPGLFKKKAKSKNYPVVHQWWLLHALLFFCCCCCCNLIFVLGINNNKKKKQSHAQHHHCGTENKHGEELSGHRFVHKRQGDISSPISKWIHRKMDQRHIDFGLARQVKKKKNKNKSLFKQKKKILLL